jgi:excisionase family DNA binding protein
MAFSGPESSAWLELSEAADYLGVHYTTLRRWADAGKVPCIRTPGGHRRFRQFELDRFLAGLAQAESGQVLAPVPPSQMLMRAHPGHSEVRNEPWYGRLDEVQRTAMRASGQQMMAVLMQYAVRKSGGGAFMEEGRRIAIQYGQICHAVHLSLVETISGFNLVRRSIADSVYQAGSLAGTPDQESWRIFDRVNNFLDTMLIDIVATYEEREKAG